MIPMVFTSAFVFFQGQQRVIAAAIVGGLASLAPTLGPVVGGFITDAWSWQWLFYINVVPGLLVAMLVPLLVRIDKPDLALLRGAGYPGIVLLALFLGCLEYVLEEGPRSDWFGDRTITACAWISGIAGAGFIVRSLTFRRPLVDLGALAIRNFSLGCWFSFVTGVGIFGTVYLTPLFLGRVRGLDAWQIGTALLSAGVFQLLAVPVYSFFANRVDLRWLMMFGLGCFAIGLWSFTPLTHDWGWVELLLPQAFRGFAQQFCVAPIVTLTLGVLPPERLRFRKRSVQPDAQSRRRHRHRGLRHNPQRPHQPSLPAHRRALHRRQRAGDEPPEWRRGALCASLGRSGSRPPGGAEKALGAGIPRGAGADVRRRLSRHRTVLRRRRPDGAADAQGRAAESALARWALVTARSLPDLIRQSIVGRHPEGNQSSANEWRWATATPALDALSFRPVK